MHLSHILALVIMFIIIMVTFILFEKLDYKFNIKIKYFSLVAKNKLVYYIVLIIWLFVLLGLLIMSYTINNYYIFIILILYFCIFTYLYHHIRNWEMAHNVYIKNVDLLIKAKEKDKEKRKK